MTPATVEDWYKRYNHKIKRYLRVRFGVNTVQSEDAVHEAFIRLQLYCKEGDIRSPYTFLQQIANNVVKEWQERHCNCKRHEEVNDSDWVTDEYELEEYLDRTRVATQVRQSLEILPPRQREILVLHTMKSMTNAQIHELHPEWTRRIIRRDLARAYETMRDHFLIKRDEIL